MKVAGIVKCHLSMTVLKLVAVYTAAVVYNRCLVMCAKYVIRVRHCPLSCEFAKSYHY